MDITWLGSETAAVCDFWYARPFQYQEVPGQQAALTGEQWLNSLGQQKQHEILREHPHGLNQLVSAQGFVNINSCHPLHLRQGLPLVATSLPPKASASHPPGQPTRAGASCCLRASSHLHRTVGPCWSKQCKCPAFQGMDAPTL